LFTQYFRLHRKILIGARKNSKKEKHMRASTKAGLLAGGVVGAAIGAGLLLSPQGKNVKHAVNIGANKVKNALWHAHIG
jgi:uncharacterized protein YcfJ